MKGRVSVEEDKDAKLICEQIVGFDEAAQAKESPFAAGRFGGMGRRNYNPGKTMPGRTPVQGAAGNQPTAGQRGKMPAGLWIQFPDAESYFAREKELLDAIAASDGNDDVVIFLKSTRGIKVLPPNRRVHADEELIQRLQELFGGENVKTVKTR